MEVSGTLIYRNFLFFHLLAHTCGMPALANELDETLRVPADLTAVILVLWNRAGTGWMFARL